jgi:hypothetical protein
MNQGYRTFSASKYALELTAKLAAQGGFSSSLHGCRDSRRFFFFDCRLGRTKSPSRISLANGHLLLGFENSEPRTKGTSIITRTA